ncbi:ribonuclease P protein component 1 [Saliphagus infecundisoli]|uniref:Ribonuclease P protein component 1 n=1 Tax=Saliphagus infecundisoli TaxID=1849069 RepID=A0ABD5QEW0_9EURY|nr:ribonuclease P protein component 1 [Saliphagus infecundisoli]
MALTPETLVRHELNGLPVRVAESDDSSRVGLLGRVVVETTNTLQVETGGGGSGRVVTVPKDGSVFEFAITDDAAGDERSPGTAFKLADAQPSTPASPESEDRAGADGAGRPDGDPSRGQRRGAGENVAYVTVDGSRLLSRPARRTETSGDSPWQ